MLRLYDSTISGNSYKVRLMLAHLGFEYEKVPVDVLSRERPAPVLEHNPSRRVPLLQLDDGRFLPESNAILCYLAEGTPWLPDDRYERARTLQWLFFEQNQHEPNIAAARFIVRFLGKDHPRAAALPLLMKGGNAALASMDRYLGNASFFVGARATVADLSLYAYTHAADEGQFDLAPYPNVQAWLGRVAALPGHESMGA